MFAPFQPGHPKPHAVADLARHFGVQDFDAWGDGVADTIGRVRQVAGPLANADVTVTPHVPPEAEERIVFGGSVRALPPPVHLTVRPQSFPPFGIDVAFSPEMRTIALPDGVVWNCADSSVVLAADGRTLIQPYSSRYGGLVHYYAASAAEAVASARFIDATAVVMSDDIRPLNYVHWMLDWLPRLAALGFHARRRDCWVITTPLVREFQERSLAMCGIPRERVVAFEPFQAVRARTLVATRDIAAVPHPAFKAAPWALAFLRSHVLAEALRQCRDRLAGAPRRIYVSRADAAGRRILNEDELVAALAKRGYACIVPGRLPLAEQAALLGQATHVVGLHGAGLANIAFMPEGGTVVEILPASYGMPTYYALSAGLEMQYCSYVEAHVAAGPHPQMDDLLLDVPAFMRRCGDLL